MPTICRSCGRELAPTVIPGDWQCGGCYERDTPRRREERRRMSTPASRGGAAPPPEERQPPEEPTRPGAAPETPAAAIPPPEAETQAEVVPARQVVAERPVQRLSGLPATTVRAEPTWRELGHWLGLAEADDGTAASRQAGAALRLYLLWQMDLPLWGAKELSLIKGKLTMSASLLRYLAKRHGYLIERVDDSDTSCTAVLILRSTGHEVGRATFTIEDAQRAGLVRAGSNWQTYPARMLWARASAYAVRDFAPEVTFGMQTEDEAREAYARQPEPIGVDIDAYGAELREADEDIPF